MPLLWLFSLIMLSTLLILREKLTHKLGLIWFGYTLFLLGAGIRFMFYPKPISGIWIFVGTLHHLLLLVISLKLEHLYKEFKNLAQKVALSAPQKKSCVKI